MQKIKKTIKDKLPDSMIYFYKIIRLIPRYLRSVLSFPKIKVPQINFWTDEETVDFIVNNGKSLSRFGDGEFMWMNGIGHLSFQEYSAELGEDLKHAFQNHNPNLLIGIPYGIYNSSGCNIYAKMHWRIIKNDFLGNSINLIDKNRTYCNASITRPYIDYTSRQFSAKAFMNLKRIWNSKDIVIVEGEATKMGLGNDLFSNAKSIRRIICPSKNAYSKISEIKEAVCSNVDKNTILLGALGPTASILASQLTDEGYQFVDIGHIDVEYMWFINHSILRDPIKGKHVNESGIDTYDQTYDHEKNYLDSIIAKI